MYDKKQALGFILIIMVVMTYSQFVITPAQPPVNNQQPPANQAPLGNQTQPTTNNSNFQPVTNSATSINSNNAPQNKAASLSESAQAPKTIIQTGVSTISISHLGARIEKLELNNFKKELNGNQAYDLVSKLEGVGLPGGLSVGNINDELTTYKIKSITGFEQISSNEFRPSAQGNATIEFEGSLSNNSQVIKSYKFNRDSYLFRIEASTNPNQNLAIYWPINLSQEELHHQYDPYFFSILFDNNKVKHIPAVGDLSSLSSSQNAQWLAFGDRYFSTAIIPNKKQQNINVNSSSGSFVLNTFGDGSGVQLEMFAGPKIYQVLKNQGQQLERIIDLGFFSFLAYPLLQLLKFLYSIFSNYGVAIVALTLLVKTIFYPLNKASLKSMKSMQELGPEIQALKERVKDSTQLNQEMLALYKRKGVNPMGGCLPVFIQIPVFFGLYSALQNAVELRHAPFALWVKDLATPEQLHIFGINVPVIVLAMGAIMFLQQYYTPMPNMDPAQRKVTLAMSVVFTFMFLIFPFPAGLAVYMLVNTVISLVQQQCLKSQTLNKPFGMTVIASVAILACSFILSKL